MAAAALLFSGVAVAQETAPTDDPQTMCEAAGGEWGGDTCWNVWCDYDPATGVTTPAICAWMASQSPTGAEPAAPTQPAQTVEPAPSVSTQTGGTSPSYTG